MSGRRPAGTEQLLAAAVAAVRSALGSLRAGLGTAPRVVATKGGTDPVTTADLDAQAAVAQLLAAATPELPVRGEETPGVDRLDAGGLFWTVDPLCGTVNYQAGLPLCCVNVALVAEGRAEVAAVGEVHSGAVLAAARGRGAWLVGGDGRPRPLPCRPPPPLLALDLGEATGPRRAAALAALGRAPAWELRVLGSSLVYAHLARRMAAAVVHLSPSVWDSLPGRLLAAEAGAVVVDLPDGPAGGGVLAAWAPATASAVLDRLAATGGPA